MKIELDNQFEFHGLESYRIDSVYDPLEKISLDHESDGSMPMDTDFCEGIQKMPKRVRVHSFQCKDLKVFRKDSTQSQPSTKYDSSADGSGSRKNEGNKPSYTEIMQERWLNTTSALPT